jgi:uncharacterized protein YjbJ (UPF0337 family)
LEHKIAECISPPQSDTLLARRETMTWTQMEGMWEQAKTRVQRKWGKLTNDDLDLIGGRRDRLEGKIQQRYGFAPDHVRKEVDDWVRWQVARPRNRKVQSRSVLATR